MDTQVLSMIGRDEDGLCDLFITNAKGLCSPHSMEASSGLVTEGTHAQNAINTIHSIVLVFLPHYLLLLLFLFFSSSSYTQLVSTPKFGVWSHWQVT